MSVIVMSELNWGPDIHAWTGKIPAAGRGEMRLADYVAEFVAHHAAQRVFMITGGFSMHLNDAFGHHPGLAYTCMHHEQALVMAADAYVRRSGQLGVVCVTAGPGATNTLTGVVSAYFDSIPMLIFAGQAKPKDVRYAGVRQYAVQGFDTLSIFQHVTNYAVLIDDPKRIRYELEKALYLAFSGRPGPVWIEIPLELQAATINPDQLEGFVPPQPMNGWKAEVSAKMPQWMQMLSNAKRPLLLLGNGLKLSHTEWQALAFAERLQIPVVVSRLAIDIISSDHPLYVGRPGLYGDRASHFAIQNCDLLMSLGCRRCMALVGYNTHEFAKNAAKIVVEIDANELGKPIMDIDLAILSDLRTVFEQLEPALDSLHYTARPQWAAQCRRWREQYPTVLPEYAKEQKDGINSYYITDRISALSSPGDAFVVDTSSPFHVVSQSVRIQKGQSFITTGGLSPMGFGLPAAVGAAHADEKHNAICIVGDGSLQMNIQELQTMVHYRLPLKLFVINNQGYLLIRHTQTNYQEGRLVGEGPQTGVTCPDMGKLSVAYGLPFVRVSHMSELDEAIQRTLATKGPAVCEISSPVWQAIIPRVASEKTAEGKMVSKPYDDLFPFLPREEYAHESTFCERDDADSRSGSPAGKK